MQLPTIDETHDATLLGPSSEDGTASSIEGLPGWFTLHYQPELDLDTRSLVACEALLRWWHPDFGLLHPGASLHRTKWDDTLAAVERWALLAALRQAQAWQHDGHRLPIALNVSRRQLGDTGFMGRLTAALEETGTAPDLLAVDIPLIAFTKAPVATRRVTIALRNLGITVIADGVSGDRYRTSLEGAALTALKVPVYAAGRRRPGLHPSVAAARALAVELGAEAVAKAVESEADLVAVRKLGFTRGFGHVFSPALTAERMSAALAANDPFRADRATVDH